MLPSINVVPCITIASPVKKVTFYATSHLIRYINPLIAFFDHNKNEFVRPPLTTKSTFDWKTCFIDYSTDFNMDLIGFDNVLLCLYDSHDQMVKSMFTASEQYKLYKDRLCLEVDDTRLANTSKCRHFLQTIEYGGLQLLQNPVYTMEDFDEKAANVERERQNPYRILVQENCNKTVIGICNINVDLVVSAPKQVEKAEQWYALILSQVHSLYEENWGEFIYTTFTSKSIDQFYQPIFVFNTVKHPEKGPVWSVAALAQTMMTMYLLWICVPMSHVLAERATKNAPQPGISMQDLFQLIIDYTRLVLNAVPMQWRHEQCTFFFKMLGQIIVMFYLEETKFVKKSTKKSSIVYQLQKEDDGVEKLVAADNPPIETFEESSNDLFNLDYLFDVIAQMCCDQSSSDRCVFSSTYKCLCKKSQNICIEFVLDRNKDANKRTAF